MSLTDSNYTDNYNYINNEEDFSQIDSMMSIDVPNGWSSICLDDTITYYIECNMSLVKNRTKFRLIIK